MRKRTTAFLAAIVFGAMGSVYAMYSVTEKGTWPTTWPKELEPLRKQSRTLVGPTVPQEHYEIPFAKREEFEAAWPHILKIKSKGAPIILMRGPDSWLGKKMNAGIRIHCPPAGTDRRLVPEGPIPGQTNPRTTWMATNFIELIADGEVVDLNRIPLPPDTPIIDERATERPEPRQEQGRPTPRPK